MNLEAEAKPKEKFQSGCNKIINKNFLCCRKNSSASLKMDPRYIGKFAFSLFLLEPYFSWV